MAYEGWDASDTMEDSSLRQIHSESMAGNKPVKLIVEQVQRYIIGYWGRTFIVPPVATANEPF
jgi:hypothetical protein